MSIKQFQASTVHLCIYDAGGNSLVLLLFFVIILPLYLLYFLFFLLAPSQLTNHALYIFIISSLDAL